MYLRGDKKMSYFFHVFNVLQIVANYDYLPLGDIRAPKFNTVHWSPVKTGRVGGRGSSVVSSY